MNQHIPGSRQAARGSDGEGERRARAKRVGLNLTQGVESLLINTREDADYYGVQNAVCHDILICVTEARDDQIRLTASLPRGLRYWLVRENSGQGSHDIVEKTFSGLQRLTLARHPGQAIVIRKREEVSPKEAVADLNKNSIGIRFSPYGFKDQQGTPLEFASSDVWEILRLELTMVRHGTMVELPHPKSR